MHWIDERNEEIYLTYNNLTYRIYASQYEFGKFCKPLGQTGRKRTNEKLPGLRSLDILIVFGPM
jgi:hypothetical protein